MTLYKYKSDETNITFAKSKKAAKIYLDSLIERMEIKSYKNLRLAKVQVPHIIGWKTWAFDVRYDR